TTTQLSVSVMITHPQKRSTELSINHATPEIGTESGRDERRRRWRVTARRRRCWGGHNSSPHSRFYRTRSRFSLVLGGIPRRLRRAASAGNCDNEMVGKTATDGHEERYGRILTGTGIVDRARALCTWRDR